MGSVVWCVVCVVLLVTSNAHPSSTRQKTHHNNGMAHRDMHMWKSWEHRTHASPRETHKHVKNLLRGLDMLLEDDIDGNEGDNNAPFFPTHTTVRVPLHRVVPAPINTQKPHHHVAADHQPQTTETTQGTEGTQPAGTTQDPETTQDPQTTQTKGATEATQQTSESMANPAIEFLRAILKEPNLARVLDPRSDQASHTKTKLRYGIPLPETHPHLFANGEVTPGLDAEEYKSRRHKLGELLQTGDVVVLPSAPEIFVSADTEADYVQNSEVMYFLGVSDPQLTLVFHKQDAKLELIVWVAPSPKTKAKFASPSKDVLLQHFAVDQVVEGEEGAKAVLAIVEAATNLYFDTKINHHVAHALKVVLDKKDPQPPKMIHRLRAIKSEKELRLLNDVWKVSAEAITWCMKATKSGVHEAMLRGVAGLFLEKEYAHFAYTPIIAGGDNAHVLHYNQDMDVLREGDLVVADIGGRRFGYCADITRTWPSNCVFSQHQHAAYSAVLRVQDAIIQIASRYREEEITLKSLYTSAREMLQQEATKLGVPQNLLNDVFPHGVSHSLGLDVHDPAPAMPITDGFVFTIEPGLYLANVDEMPEHLRGINVRIEDDCIAQNGKVECPTTKLVPRTVEEIQAACGLLVRT